MLVQPGLCRTCLETTLLVFPRGGSFFSLTEETGKKAIPGDIVQPGGGIDLEFETDGELSPPFTSLILFFFV